MTLPVPLAIVMGFSGFVLTVLGIQHLLVPIRVYRKLSTNLEEHPNLLNVVRSHIGAPFLCVGIVVILGVFVEQLTLTGLILAPLFMASIGLGRIYGVLVDGKPPKSVTGSIVAEAILTVLLLGLSYVALRGP